MTIRQQRTSGALSSASDDGLTSFEVVSRNGKVLTLADGTTCTEFISCSYLGLESHPLLIQAAGEALEQIGIHLSASRSAMSPVYLRQLEQLLSDIYTGSSVTVFTSTSNAHLGVLPLLGSGTMDGYPIKSSIMWLVDRTAHASMQVLRGVLSQFGPVSRVDTQDMDGLRETLARCAQEKITPVLLIDGVGSMSGLLPVSELCELLQAWGGYLYIDDAHGISITGKHGAGWGVQFHPESIDSEFGVQIIHNFVRLVGEAQSSRSFATQSPVFQALQAAGGPMRLSLDFERLEQSPTPAQLFDANFACKPAAFWLDSELSDRPQARYSLMGSCDRDSALVFAYDVNRRLLSIDGPVGNATIKGDFFSLMEEVVDLLGVGQQQVPFPFKGGLVGYLGYELKALVGVQNAHVSELPDALFYLPQNMLVLDHDTEITYLCHIWGERLVLQPADKAVQVDNVSFNPGPVAESSLRLADCSSIYMAKVDACLRQIADGESYEICLTNRASLPCTDDPLSTYLRMRCISPVPYGAYVKTGTFSILGASPETFLKIDATGCITSKPIKGTRPRGHDPEQDLALKHDLACSSKDRAENLMIVDLVRHVVVN